MEKTTNSNGSFDADFNELLGMLGIELPSSIQEPTPEEKAATQEELRNLLVQKLGCTKEKSFLILDVAFRATELAVEAAMRHSRILTHPSDIATCYIAIALFIKSWSDRVIPTIPLVRLMNSLADPDFVSQIKE